MKVTQLVKLGTTALFSLFLSFNSYSQENSAGINVDEPNPNAVLHLVSPNNNQGLLIPTMTGAERALMSLADIDDGLLVYDTTAKAFFLYTGTATGWVQIANTGNLSQMLATDNSAGNEQIKNVVDPTALQDAATKNYVDIQSHTDNQDLTNVLGIGASAGNNAITDLADPTNLQDAATKNYVDSQGDSDNQDLANVLSIGNNAGNTIEGVLDPINAQDAATKNYVDNSVTASDATLVGNGTTGVPLGVNVGTGANQILQLDGAGALPAVDGSALTGIAASSVAANTITTVELATDAVESANILDGTITDADISDVSSGKVTGLGTSATIDVGTGANQVVQLDGAGALPAIDGSALTGVSVTIGAGTIGNTELAANSVLSGNIQDDEIVDADINATAAIAGTKIDPDFGGQNITTTGNIIVLGTVDGRTVSSDGSNQDDIQTLTGLAAGATDLGTFLGSTITANTDIVTAFQDLEVAVESVGTPTAATVVNTAAGNIASTDVQGAIDELDAEKLALAGGTMTGALNMGANNITTTGTVDGRTVSTDGTNQDDMQTLTGVAAGSTDLGTFGGSTITANTDIVTALQDLETAVESVGTPAASSVTNTAAGNIAATDVQGAINELDAEKLALAGGTMTGVLNMGANNITTTGTVDGRTVSTDGTNQDDIQTLTGLAAGSTNLGTFGGSTITANTDIVTAFQDLETAVEAAGTPAASSVTNTAAGNIAATDVQGAINELDAEKLALAGGTMTGVLNMGTNNIITTGTVDGRTVSTDGTNQDDIQTLTGLAAGSTDLGTFGGSTITANTDIVTALQDLETAVEAAGTPAASSVTNTAAGNIAATDVQGAINELDAEKLALAGGTMTGVLNMGANNITTTGTVDGRTVSTDGTNQDDIQTLTGLAAGSTDLGTFGGSTITANTDIVTAFQDLETAVEAAGTPAASSVTNTAAGNIAATDVQGAINELDAEKLALAGGTMTGVLNMGANNITTTGTVDGRTISNDGADLDDLVTLSGQAANAVNFGNTFSGSTILDNATITSALQNLESAFEAVPATSLQVAYQNGGSITTDAGNGPFSINGSESITLDATGIGAFSVAAGDLDLTTVSSGDINITPAGQITLASSGIATNVDGTLDVAEQANLNANVNLGISTANAINVNGDLSVFGEVLGANPLTFQGVTDNVNVTTLAITDPTGSNTITLPDASGEVVLSGGALSPSLALTTNGSGQIVTSDDAQPFSINSNTINLGNAQGDQVIIAGTTNNTSNNASQLLTVNNTNTGTGNAASFTGAGTNPVVDIIHGPANQPGLQSNTGIVIGNLPVDIAGALRFDGATFEGNTDGTAGGWVDFTAPSFQMGVSEDPNTVAFGAASVITSSPGNSLQVIDDSGAGGATLSAATVNADLVSNRSSLALVAARGITATPADAVGLGDFLGEIAFLGHDGTGVASGLNAGAEIRSNASEVWSAGGNGSSMSFATTLNGTTGTVERLRIRNNGSVTVTGGDLVIEGDGINARSLVFTEGNSGTGEALGFKAPDDILNTPVIWELPDGDGTSGQALTTDGSGVLSWDDAGLVLPYSQAQGENGSPLFYIENSGTNEAGRFAVSNSGSTATTLVAESVGAAGSLAFLADQTGDGASAGFQISNATNSDDAIFATTDGTGSAASFDISNAGSSAPVVSVQTAGAGATLELNNFIEFTEGSFAAVGVADNTTGAGDDLDIQAGSSANAGGGAGGNLNLSAGFGDGGAGGGPGGNVNIVAGDAGGGANPAGDIVLTVGTNGSQDGVVASEGDFHIVGDGSFSRALILENGDGSALVGFKAEDGGTNSVVWELPDGDGAFGQVLATDASGNLDWVDAGLSLPFADTDASGPGSASFDVSNNGGGFAARFSATSGAAVELDGSVTFLNGNDGNLGVADNPGGAANGLNLFAGNAGAPGTGGWVNINAGTGNGGSANGNVNLVAGYDGLGSDGRILMQGLTRFSNQNPSAAGSIQLGNNIDQFAIEIAADPGMTADYGIVLPANQGTGALTNDGGGTLSWSPVGLTLPFSDVASGSASPLFVIDNQSTGAAASFSNFSDATAIEIGGNVTFYDGSDRDIGIATNTGGPGDALNLLAGGSSDGVGGKGGNLMVQAGSGDLVNGDGGDVFINAGAAGGSGNNGLVFIDGATRFSHQDGSTPARIELEDAGGANAISISANASSTQYGIVLPATQGTGALTNDGGGNLTWTSPNPFTSVFTDDGDNVVFGSTLGAVFPSTSPNYQIGAVAPAGQAAVSASSFGGTSEFRMTRANGTESVPSGITNGDSMGEITFVGRENGGSYVPGATVRAESIENWVSTSNAGTALSFQATPSGTGSQIEMMRLEDNIVTIDGDINLREGVARTITVANNSFAIGDDLHLAAGSTTNPGSDGGILQLRSGDGNGAGNGGNIRLEPGSGTTRGGIDMRGITRFGQVSAAQSGRIELEDNGGANAIAISAHPTSNAYGIVLPQVQGTGSLTNDGSGNLTWAASSGFTTPTFDNADNTIFGATTAALSVPAGDAQLAAVVDGGAGQAILGAYSYQSGSELALVRANGNLAGPLALGAAEVIGDLGFRGHDGVTFSNPQASIRGVTTEAWAGAQRGTALSFLATVTATGALTEMMRIQDNLATIDGDIQLVEGGTRSISVANNAAAIGDDLQVAAGSTTNPGSSGGILQLRSGNGNGAGNGGNIRLEPGTGASSGGIDMRGITRFGQAGAAPGTIELEDNGGANAINISAHPTSNAYNIILPQVQAGGALTNDGSGNLTWASAGLTLPFSDSDGTTPGGSASFNISNTSTGAAARFDAASGPALELIGDLEMFTGAPRNISVGPNPGADGDNLRISAGNTTNAGSNGGVLELRSGNGSGAGNGGNIDLIPGTGTGNGVINLQGAVAGSGNINLGGGSLILQSTGGIQALGAIDADASSVTSAFYQISGTTVIDASREFRPNSINLNAGNLSVSAAGDLNMRGNFVTIPPAPTGGTFTVTSRVMPFNADVTDLDPGVEGQEVILIATAGGLTVMNTAQIRLNGGVDFGAITVNSTLQLIYYNGAWNEVSRNLQP